VVLDNVRLGSWSTEQDSQGICMEETNQCLKYSLRVERRNMSSRFLVAKISFNNGGVLNTGKMIVIGQGECG
jgi:hypothetical protein